MVNEKHNTDMLTVMQQVERLKIWHRMQEDKLKEQLNDSTLTDISANSYEKLEDCLNTASDKTVKSISRKRDKIPNDSKPPNEQELPIHPNNKNFQAILDENLERDNHVIPTHNKPRESFEFLKRGSGLSRYRMTRNDILHPTKTTKKYTTNPKARRKVEYPKEQNHKGNTAVNQDNVKPSLLENETEKCESKNGCLGVDRLNTCDNLNITSPFTNMKSTMMMQNEPRMQEEENELRLYELLEDHACDSSFCSMDSEHLENPPLIIQERVEFERTNENYKNELNCGLDTIEEEENDLTVIEDRLNNDDYHRFISKMLAMKEVEGFNSCDSECSCEEEDTRYVSRSVSLIMEESTTISPYSSAIKRKNSIYVDSVNNSPRCQCAPESAVQSLKEEQEKNEKLKNLLQARLIELENEIESFKNENMHLKKCREEYEEEYKRFKKEKELFLTRIRDDRLLEMNELEREKNTLKREKLSFENYVKEKSKPTRKEREEIKKLKDEIEELKKEVNLKEGRWGAAQARIRTQMKQLQDQNNTLKEEVEKLRKTNAKKVSFAPLSKKQSNHTIELLEKELKNVTKNDVSKKDVPQELLTKPDENVQEIVTEISSKNIDKECNDNNFDDDNFINSVNSIHVSNNVVETLNNDGNREKLFPDGRKEIWFKNGNVRKISADGSVIKTIYYNGDVKEIINDNKIVKYYYAETKAWHTTYEDGMEMIEFVDGQVEKRFKDGSVEVIYPDKTKCVSSTDGKEKWLHPDGTTVIKDKTNGEKVILLTNGQKETHTNEYKKREYPDGTIKIIYADGIQETRYSSGRVRLKNKHGELLSDFGMTS